MADEMRGYCKSIPPYGGDEALRTEEHHTTNSILLLKARIG